MRPLCTRTDKDARNVGLDDPTGPLKMPNVKRPTKFFTLLLRLVTCAAGVCALSSAIFVPRFVVVVFSSQNQQLHYADSVSDKYSAIVFSDSLTQPATPHRHIVGPTGSPSPSCRRPNRLTFTVM